MKNVARTTKCLFGGTLLAAGVAAPASAQFQLFVNDPGGFNGAIGGYIQLQETNFDLDPSYPIIGFDGPLTSAGGGPVPAGRVAPYLSLNSVNYAFNNMVSVGPHNGFGNPSNAILANYFADTFTMDFAGGVDATHFNALTLLGSTSVDITVTGSGGSQTFFGVNVSGALGANIGVVGMSSDITRITILDPVGGAEGVQGRVDAWLVPAPASAALIALGGLVAARRRR